MKKHIAFTLAETLIVMGIIGIVAALTLPNLNNSTGNKEKVAKLRKLYTNFSDAYGRAIAIYGPIEEWAEKDDKDNSEIITERISEFMKISKYCGKTNPTECMVYGSYTNLPTFITADGTSVMVWAHFNCSGSSDDYASIHDTSCGAVVVDLDGSKKGKNQLGLDIFQFIILKKNGVIPRGSQILTSTSTDEGLKDKCFTNFAPPKGRSEYCAGFVIETGSMDYLKLDSNYQCPNKKELTWSSPFCN